MIDVDDGVQFNFRQDQTACYHYVYKCGHYFFQFLISQVQIKLAHCVILVAIVSMLNSVHLVYLVSFHKNKIKTQQRHHLENTAKHNTNS